jgi:hypothetical protein
MHVNNMGKMKDLQDKGQMEKSKERLDRWSMKKGENPLIP